MVEGTGPSLALELRALCLLYTLCLGIPVSANGYVTPVTRR